MSSPYQESAPLACIFLGCSVCQWLHQANFHLSPGTALFFSHSLMLDGWIRLHVSQQPVARCCCALRMDGWVRRPEASDWDGVVCMAPVSGILTRLVVLDVVPDGRFGCGWWWVGRWVWHRGSTFLARLPVPPVAPLRYRTPSWPRPPGALDVNVGVIYDRPVPSFLPEFPTQCLVPSHTSCFEAGWVHAGP